MGNKVCFLLEYATTPYEAVVRENKHMVDMADTIICYLKHIDSTWSLLEYAQRQRKKEGIIIENMAEDF